MNNPQHLSVQEFQVAHVPLLLDYWFNASPEHLPGMGVDPRKMPTRAALESMLLQQLQTPIEQRRSYALVWCCDDKPVGHSNTNPTYFGKEATMHLHLWQSPQRLQGWGTEFVRMSLPWYFGKLRLQTLWCEPYALNPAPNRTLEKVGFQLQKEYVTTPGSINFEQPVKRWCMTRAQFMLALAGS